MKIINLEEKYNGAIGIGAMIVFIALILVAAVASAVIIQTGEKLQQNAQQTGSDTQREMSGKIAINNMIVDGATSYTLYFESSAGSGNIVEADVQYQMTCDDGGYKYVTGTFVGATEMDGSAASGIEPGKPYKITLTDADCDPVAMVGKTVTFWIHVKNGGSTYELLNVVSSSVGSMVV